MQTERAAHERIADLIKHKPNSAILLHILIARMGPENKVVVSQKTMAKMMQVSPDTVKRAVRDLRSDRWIQVVKLNGPGTVNVYVVNDRVAWGQPRDQLFLSNFSATVIADYADQDAESLDDDKVLRRIPSLFAGERQLPSGPGEEPPSQPSLDGMEPDLPSLTRPDLEEAEARGQQRLVE